MPVEEQRLIDAAISGDSAAFEKLVQPLEGRIYAVALRMCGNREDAQDCMQEAMIRIYRALSSFKGQSSFSTWVYRITMNTCLMSCAAGRTSRAHPWIPCWMWDGRRRTASIRRKSTPCNPNCAPRCMPPYRICPRICARQSCFAISKAAAMKKSRSGLMQTWERSNRELAEDAKNSVLYCPNSRNFSHDVRSK